jgi:hypothetical protein
MEFEWMIAACNRSKHHSSQQLKIVGSRSTPVTQSQCCASPCFGASQAGEFLEHADVHGNLYGTSLGAVRDVASKGQICVMDIDIQVRCAGGCISEHPRVWLCSYLPMPSISAVGGMSLSLHSLKVITLAPGLKHEGAVRGLRSNFSS